MTIAEIILLIALIIVSIIHVILYVRYCKLKEWAEFSSALIHDFLTGKIELERKITEEEFFKIMNGGKNPNEKKK